MRFIQPCCENMYLWIKNGTVSMWRNTDGTLDHVLAGCKGPNELQICYCPSCGTQVRVIGVGEE